MTKQTLNIAGWLSLIYAVTTIPIFVLYWFAENLAGVTGGKLIESILSVVSLFLFVFLCLRFKRLLNERFNFNKVDDLIRVIIGINALLSGFDLIVKTSQSLKTFNLIVSVICLVILGVLGIVFAIRLLDLPNSLFGFLKPYCITYMASSFLIGTVILAPLGLIVGAASSVLLGMIFFKAAEEQDSQGLSPVIVARNIFPDTK